MAPNAERIEVLRVVVREGLSRDLAFELVHDIGAVIDHLKTGNRPPQPSAPAASPAPGHRRGATRLAGPPNTTKKTHGVC
jgi:hypothetical protein